MTLELPVTQSVFPEEVSLGGKTPPHPSSPHSNTTAAIGAQLRPEERGGRTHREAHHRAGLFVICVEGGVVVNNFEMVGFW